MTSETQSNLERVQGACALLMKDHDLETRAGKAQATMALEHTIAVMLLSISNGNAKRAASLMNEMVVPHVEVKLALYASKKRANG